MRRTRDQDEHVVGPRFALEVAADGVLDERVQRMQVGLAPAPANGRDELEVAGVCLLHVLLHVPWHCAQCILSDADVQAEVFEVDTDVAAEYVCQELIVLLSCQAACAGGQACIERAVLHVPEDLRRRRAKQGGKKKSQAQSRSQSQAGTKARLSPHTQAVQCVRFLLRLGKRAPRRGPQALALGARKIRPCMKAM